MKKMEKISQIKRMYKNKTEIKHKKNKFKFE